MWWLKARLRLTFREASAALSELGVSIETKIHLCPAMDSAGLRRRSEQRFDFNSASAQDSGSNASDGGDEPPRYTIDLSLPPRKRYQHIVANFKPQIATLPILFDEVVKDLRANISVQRVRWLARLLLRQEENEELRGIQETTGVEMYLLVAFNVLLDLLMGCTSGAVRVRDVDNHTKMLHFRTLDWGMDALRKVIVHLDFIEKPGGEIIVRMLGQIHFPFLENLKSDRFWKDIVTNQASTLILSPFRWATMTANLKYRPRVSRTLAMLEFLPGSEKG